MTVELNGSRREGFSLIEILAVIVTVMLLLAVLPMFMRGGHRPTKRSHCVSNLKQVALAARMWSMDHDEKLPWQMSTNEGGTMEWAASPEVFRHFAVMSNELYNPTVFVCLADGERLRARSFAPMLANSNVSYFVGLDASSNQPQSILSGDRNIIGGITNGALLSFRSNDVPQWASNIHTNQGSIALADGSVQHLTDQALASQFQTTFEAQASMTTLRLAIPRTPQDTLAGKRPGASVRPFRPWIAACLAMVAMFVGWLMLRRQLLARASEPS